MWRTALLALVFVSIATEVAALVPGGGSKRTDCFAEFSGVTLNFPPPPRRPKILRCRDGDPCDADGMANGVCSFLVGICLDQADPTLPDCTPPPDGISTFVVRNPPPGDPRHDAELDSLAAAASALLPATSGVCSTPVTLTVPVVGPDRGGGFAMGKKIVRTVASTPGGRRDTDHLRLQCLPNPAAATDWPTYGFDLSRDRFNPREGLVSRQSVPRLRVRWFFPTGGAVSASPSVVGGVAYVGSWDGKLYALDAFDGTLHWSFDIQDPNPGDRTGFPGIQSSAAVVGDAVYFGAADANVYALDRATGGLLWRTSLGNPDTAVEGAHVWSSPAVFDGKVYVGKSSHLDAPCVRGAVVALDAATGSEAWRFKVLPDNICSNDAQKPCTSNADCPGGSCNPFRVCRSNAGAQTQTAMCLSDADCTAPATCQPPLGGGVVSSITVDTTKGVLYVSTGDCVGFGAAGFANSLLALDAGTGALRWSFPALPQGNLSDFDFIASPNLFTASDGATTRALVGAGSKNGVYYALDPDTGALVWQQLVNPGAPNLFGGFNASAGVAFGKIFAGTFSGPPFIFALDAFGGLPTWGCPGSVCTAFSFGPPGIGDHVALMGDSAGLLRAFDVDTGAVLRTIDLGGAISSGPAVVNGMVIVGAGTGGFGMSTKQGVYGLILGPTPLETSTTSTTTTTSPTTSTT